MKSKITVWLVENGNLVKMLVTLKEFQELDDDIVPYFLSFQEATEFAIACLNERVADLEKQVEKKARG